MPVLGYVCHLLNRRLTHSSASMIIANSSNRLFHRANIETISSNGVAIFSNLGHVSKPSGGFSIYGVPGIIITEFNYA